MPSSKSKSKSNSKRNSAKNGKRTTSQKNNKRTASGTSKRRNSAKNSRANSKEQQEKSTNILPLQISTHTTTLTVDGVPVTSNFVMTTASGKVMGKEAHEEWREKLQQGEYDDDY